MRVSAALFRAALFMHRGLDSTVPHTAGLINKARIVSSRIQKSYLSQESVAMCEKRVDQLKDYLHHNKPCDVVSQFDLISNTLCVNMDTTNALRLVRLYV
jgi:hypothetical protein